MKARNPRSAETRSPTLAAVVEPSSPELLAQQYADDRNLAARQSIYAFARPGPTIFDTVLELAALTGDERIVDVGCGNGLYLAALAGAGHAGAVHGFDLSAGMLHAAGGWKADAGLAVADAQHLPIATGAADVAFANHMLYHVPDQAAAVAELRRVLRPGGVALLATNSGDHVRELDDLSATVAAEITGSSATFLRAMLAFRLEDGAAVLRTAFEHVERHDCFGVLDLTDPRPAGHYVASTSSLYGVTGDEHLAAAVAEVERRVAEVIERDGVFTVTTAAGAFRCS